MKRLLLLLILISNAAWAAPGDELSPQARAYVDKVISLAKYEYLVKQINHPDESVNNYFRKIRGSISGRVRYDPKKPEEGVQVWYSVTWYKLIDDDGTPTLQEIMEGFVIQEDELDAIPYGAACALVRGCPLTVGLRPNRFADTGLFVAVPFTPKEVIEMCSKTILP